MTPKQILDFSETLLQDEPSDTDLSLARRSPKPKPTGPQPPGGPPPANQPPEPKPQPLRDAPSGPEPPGGPHGFVIHSPIARSWEATVKMRVLERPQSLPARCVVLDDFLAPREAADLLSYALLHEADFQSSEVISALDGAGIVNTKHRRSRVLMDTGKHGGIIFDRIQCVLPMVLESLDIEKFSVSRIEAQVTASNDGDFFRNHHDNLEPEVATRHLTFVYFLHNEPRRFEGGELRIHDARLEEGQYIERDSYHTVVPRQNRIVFFPCSLLHEITPVVCPSQLFADSRFTLNGWLHG